MWPGGGWSCGRGTAPAPIFTLTPPGHDRAAPDVNAAIFLFPFKYLIWLIAQSQEGFKAQQRVANNTSWVKMPSSFSSNTH